MFEKKRSYGADCIECGADLDLEGSTMIALKKLQMENLTLLILQMHYPD